MDISTIIPHIEAIIFASDKPVPTLELVELINNALGFMEDRANLDQVESALDAITEKYSSEFYPFHIRESGGGWQFLTKAAFHPTIAQLNGSKFMKKLSTAALETLAIIAYKQPITKGEIENIRGVNCDYAVQKLLEKELVIITGRKENAPGQPLIYATSKTFMDYFGINSPADLPQLSDVMNQDVVNPTEVTESSMVDEDMPESDLDEQASGLLIDENGEIIENNNTGASVENDDEEEGEPGIEDAGIEESKVSASEPDESTYKQGGESEEPESEFPESEDPEETDDGQPAK